MIVGYDPRRVDMLAQLSRQALWSLSAITSTDPEAASTIHAVRRLHRTIETGVLAAADDVLRSAPLSRSFGAHGATAADVQRRHRSTTTMARSSMEGGSMEGVSADGAPTEGARFRELVLELIRRLAMTQLALLSDDELLLHTRAELTAAADETRLVDIDSAHHAVLSTALGDELQRRAEASAAFAARLVEYSQGDPLLALAVARSDMRIEIKAAVFAATVTAGPGRPSLDHVRGEAVRLFLADAGDDAAFALEAIGQDGLIEGILDWEGISNTWVELGVDEAVDLVDAAFSSPTTYDLGTRDDPGSSESTARSLAALIDLMNSAHGDRGLPPELSAAYTAGLIPLLPRFVNGFDGDEVFRLRRDDRSPVPVVLGATSESMTDLFGGLARHDVSHSMLVGSVAALGRGIGTHYTAEQLAGYAAILGTSMANEQREEELHSQRQAARWSMGLTLLETALDSTGAIGQGAGAPTGLGFDLARWSVGHLVDRDELGLDDTPRVIEMLLVVALAGHLTTAIRPHHENNPNNEPDHHAGDDDAFGLVRAQLTRIEKRLAMPDADDADISGDVDLLRDLVDLAIDDGDLDAAAQRRAEQVWGVLDHDVFTEPPFRSETVTDVDD